ncbi:hypothetical protein IG631_18321 [Alternaria alternata]|nr:hypothetical protein IG631_18321 [Alternaria alternata]
MPETTQRPLQSVELIRRGRDADPLAYFIASAVTPGVPSTSKYTRNGRLCLPQAHINSSTARACACPEPTLVASMKPRKRWFFAHFAV